MRTTALKISQLWKLRGGKAVIQRLFSQYTSKIYATRTDNLYLFKQIQTNIKHFEGYNLSLQEVPESDPTPWDPEITLDNTLIANRFSQGARRYAAIWDGRGIDVCWAVSDCIYHDSIDNFTMQLGHKDVYLFDYRGIQKNRPSAFSRFQLWSQLCRKIIDSENIRCDGNANFYTLVASHNRVSNAFHTRKLQAKLIGHLHTKVLFGKPAPIINTDTPPIFIQPAN